MLRAGAFFLAVVTSTTHAMDIKGIAIGMPASAVLAKYPYLKCAPMSHNREVCGDSRPADKPTYKMVAPELETYAGERVLAFMVGIGDGDVRLVTIKLETRHYDAVSAALTERHGKPASSRTSTVQNRMGAKFDQEERIWREGEARLMARRRSSMIDQMEVSLSTESVMREDAECAKEKAKSGAGDL